MSANDVARGANHRCIAHPRTAHPCTSHFRIAHFRIAHFCKAYLYTTNLCIAHRCAALLHCVLAAVLAAVLAQGSAALAAEIRLTDDSGRSVMLKQPARRIISLAPHMTELLFAAGAGEYIVGTVEYSNFPAAAPAHRAHRRQRTARPGTHCCAQARPDRGLAERQCAAPARQLLRLGIPVFYNASHRLSDIARAIEQLGRLAGMETVAMPAARAFVRARGRVAPALRRPPVGDGVLPDLGQATDDGQRRPPHQRCDPAMRRAECVRRG